MGCGGWWGGVGSWWEGVGGLSLVIGAHSAIISTGIGRRWKRIRPIERDNSV